MLVFIPNSQAYKGNNLECSLPVSSFEKLHEARVRCWTIAAVNGRDEQLWSAYSPIAHCQCIQESWKEEVTEKQSEPLQKEVKNVRLSPQMIAMVFVLVGAVLTLVLAFVLGQYVV